MKRTPACLESARIFLGSLQESRRWPAECFGDGSKRAFVHQRTPSSCKGTQPLPTCDRDAKPPGLSRLQRRHPLTWVSAVRYWNHLPHVAPRHRILITRHYSTKFNRLPVFPDHGAPNKHVGHQILLIIGVHAATSLFLEQTGVTP
jgi:hypothetical protein